jgi:DHA3 family tetracycline resistance protein-like MFS transporter
VRDFALLWSGQTVSSLGDGIFTIALAIVTLEVDHHPSGLALVFAARALPSVLLSLVGGVVVDRVSRRRAMLSSDAIRGVAVGVIGLLVGRGELHLWELIVMAAIFGTADSFFFPASTAIMPELLEADLLVSGNALSSMSGQLSQGLIGPAVGGVVVAAIGTAWSFGFDAASFFVSATCLSVMRSHRVEKSSGRSPLEDARDGLRYVIKRPWLFYSILGAGLANFFGMAPLSVLLPLFVRQTLHASAFSFGMVFAAGGAAGIIASLVVARMGKLKRQVTVLWSAYGVSGIVIALFAFAPNVAVTIAISAVEVGLMIYGDVLFFAMLQRLVPGEVLGRVSSLVFLFAFSLGPLGIVFGGAAASAIGTRHALLLCGLISGVICFAVLLVPGVRDPDLIDNFSAPFEAAPLPSELDRFDSDDN